MSNLRTLKDRPSCNTRTVSKTDRPSCELKTEAEVWIVRFALADQLERLNLAVSRLEARKATQAFMMTKHRDNVKAVLEGIPEGAHAYLLANKLQVDRAADACEGLITKLRFAQRDDWTNERAAMIRIIGPLLDRIRIGWKKPAPIPDEVLAQIKAREDNLFWNPQVGEWLREEDESVYVWKAPDWDCVETYEWKGI